MNATSTEEFKDIIAIDFELQTFPNPDVQDKFIVSATNRDDIFCFVFEGTNLADACRKTGLFAGWEKEEEIKRKNREINDLHHKLHEAGIEKRRLEEELGRWKDNIDDLLTEIRKLKELKTPTIENFADEEPSSRSDILKAAEKCVCGKREQDYGTPESNFQLIADLWNQYLFKDPNVKEVFSIGPMDVAMLMALMKIARIRNGGGSGDSFVDLAGYAACGGEIWHLNKEIPGDSSQETN